MYFQKFDFLEVESVGVLLLFRILREVMSVEASLILGTRSEEWSVSVLLLFRNLLKGSLWLRWGGSGGWLVHGGDGGYVH